MLLITFSVVSRIDKSFVPCLKCPHSVNELSVYAGQKPRTTCTSREYMDSIMLLTINLRYIGVGNLGVLRWDFTISSLLMWTLQLVVGSLKFISIDWLLIVQVR